MGNLRTAKCEPCEGGVEPLGPSEIDIYLKEIDAEWAVSEDRTSIYRVFTFPGFNRTMGFVNAVAWIANTEGHHPDLAVAYGRCRVTYRTNAIGGLSVNDFICAAKIDALVEP